MIRGIDVSSYQGKIDFKKVKASGIDFVFGKCSEYHEDANYYYNKKNAQAEGLLFGAYHFFHPLKDPKAQADMFLKTADLKAGDLLPVLDWETTEGFPVIQDVLRACAWLDIVQKACGKRPIIYGSPYFLKALILNASFITYPLWVAHYEVEKPMVPPPWKTWTFWQQSDNNFVSGVSSKSDLDLFNGTLDDLKNFTI